MLNRSRRHRPQDTHKAARLSINLYCQSYAVFNGGAMDFWDSLGKGYQDTCRQILKSIDKAPTEAESNARFVE